MADGGAFMFTDSGIIEMGVDPVPAPGASIEGNRISAERKLAEKAALDAAPAVAAQVARAHRRAAAKSPVLTPGELMRMVRARVREIKALLRTHAALERELSELQAVLAASKLPAAKLPAAKLPAAKLRRKRATRNPAPARTASSGVPTDTSDNPHPGLLERAGRAAAFASFHFPTPEDLERHRAEWSADHCARLAAMARTNQESPALSADTHTQE